MFKSQKKGTLVESSDELESRYFAIASQPYATQLLEFDPAAPRPMVQEFFRDAATGIYNISAFVHSGRLCGALGARKLLQQPRRVGTGVCFEEAPVVPELAAGLERLAVQVGFSGVFEAEFINADANPLLIDFNPRFYNQMQFDIARGLPLPLLAYHDALGNHRDVEGLVDRVQLEDGPGNRVYVDLISLRTLFWAQGLSGAISPAERKQWNDWYMQHRDRCIYAAFDPDDKIPFWVAAVQHVARSARHPRHFLRSMVLNRS
jgi:hypothetical protein